ncbi:MAG: phosphatidylglycerophosphatase A [Planctomycetota bacterium]|nr:MAG: phosphatidylglycerophosphatase A [Planctomycetota bacterium]
MAWWKSLDGLRVLLVTSFGLGYAPIASGTFGTLGGVALAAWIGFTWPRYFLLACLVLVVVLCLLGAPQGDWAERRYGRKDPGEYVLDEVVGYLVAVAWPTFGGWTHLGAAFLLFRVTDITKPWPARRLEKVPGGWGILLDDLVAGLWAWLVLAVVRQFMPEVFAP